MQFFNHCGPHRALGGVCAWRMFLSIGTMTHWQNYLWTKYLAQAWSFNLAHRRSNSMINSVYEHRGNQSKEIIFGMQVHIRREKKVWSAKNRPEMETVGVTKWSVWPRVKAWLVKYSDCCSRYRTCDFLQGQSLLVHRLLLGLSFDSVTSVDVALSISLPSIHATINQLLLVRLPGLRFACTKDIKSGMPHYLRSTMQTVNP